MITSGDGFVNAVEINDLFEGERPVGQPYVRLKELGIPVERKVWIDEVGTAYVVDLGLPIEDAWLTVAFGDRAGPNVGLRFAAVPEPGACLRKIQARLGAT